MSIVLFQACVTGSRLADVSEAPYNKNFCADYHEHEDGVPCNAGKYWQTSLKLSCTDSIKHEMQAEIAVTRAGSSYYHEQFDEAEEEKYETELDSEDGHSGEKLMKTGIAKCLEARYPAHPR